MVHKAAFLASMLSGGLLITGVGSGEWEGEVGSGEGQKGGINKCGFSVGD